MGGSAIDVLESPEMTRIMFLADEDISGVIVRGIRQREPAVDILTAREGGILGLSDPEVLARGWVDGAYPPI